MSWVGVSQVKKRGVKEYSRQREQVKRTVLDKAWGILGNKR